MLIILPYFHLLLLTFILSYCLLFSLPYSASSIFLQFRLALKYMRFQIALRSFTYSALEDNAYPQSISSSFKISYTISYSAQSNVGFSRGCTLRSFRPDNLARSAASSAS
jgi:hypothetical protein